MVTTDPMVNRMSTGTRTSTDITLTRGSTVTADTRVNTVTTSMVTTQCLETMFLMACKTGNVATVIRTIDAGMDVNQSQGWGLRRAVRYRHPQLWQILLKNPACQVNLTNNFGLSALHTACRYRPLNTFASPYILLRFGVAEAVISILQHPGVLVNEKTRNGSTPLMVAVKYGEKVVVDIMIRDNRVDLGTVDLNKRSLYEVVGVAVEAIDETVKHEIIEMIKTEASKRSLRKKKKGVHKVLDPSQLIVKQARDKVDKLVSDMEENQRIEMKSFQENLENNSREFNEKQKEELDNFAVKLEEEKNIFFENQEKQRKIHLSELEHCKYVFLRMQEEARLQFERSEKLHLAEFKEIQAKQRQSFLLNNKEEELIMPMSQNTSNQKSKSPRNLNILPDVSNLVGRNSSSLPIFQSTLSGDNVVQSLGPDQMTRSLNIPGPENNRQLCHRKSAPVMGQSLTKENNTDQASADQYSHLATNFDWRKTSCPSSTAKNERYPEQDPHSYPDTPPVNLQYLRGQTLSPSNTSSNPSPVPSLEYILPNELFTNIPDTCPNIKALVNSHEVFVAPKNADTRGSSSHKSTANSPSNATIPTTAVPPSDLSPLCLRVNNSRSRSPTLMHSHPSSFAPVKSSESLARGQQEPTQSNFNLSQLLQGSSSQITNLNLVPQQPCLQTPRLARKSAMEVVKEEEDDHQMMKDDEEIAELTNTGISRNKSASFTNLVSNMKSPTTARTIGDINDEEQGLNKKGEENKIMFFIEMDTEDILEEGMNERIERSNSLQDTGILYQDIKENISKEISGISLASSTSTASFKSAQTSPIKEFI